MILFIDGARLDEFTYSSGESSFTKFLDAGPLAQCRQFMPVYGTAVKHCKVEKTAYDSQYDDDYIVHMMQEAVPFFDKDGVEVMTAVILADGERVQKTVRVKFTILTGDYPMLCRYTNTRNQHCPFCLYLRNDIMKNGDVSAKKDARYEFSQLKKCVSMVWCVTAIRCDSQAIDKQWGDAAVKAAEKEL